METDDGGRWIQIPTGILIQQSDDPEDVLWVRSENATLAQVMAAKERLDRELVDLHRRMSDLNNLIGIKQRELQGQ